jgi:hypothetical protein
MTFVMSVVPNEVSVRFRKALLQCFLETASGTLQKGNKSDFLSAIKRFIMWDTSSNENPYPSREIRSVPFHEGEKHVILRARVDEVKEQLIQYGEFASKRYELEKFRISGKRMVVVTCPDNISFYDFNLLIQYLGAIDSNAYGLYSSAQLEYVARQDRNSQHNMVGITNDYEKFSIYLLGDLRTPYLSIDDSIEIDEDFDQFGKMKWFKRCTS